MEPITKLLDKNLSQWRYEEIVRRGCFWPLSCLSAILGYSTHVTQAQFVVLSMAFFILYSLQIFILYKSELLQIRTILVVIDVAIKLLLVLGILRNLWTVGLWAFFNFVLFRYERLQSLLFLVLIRCLLSLFLWLQLKFLLRLRFLRHLRSFQGPSSPFFFSSLEFGYVCYSSYCCHICYSVFLDSGFLEVLLGFFPF